MISVGDLYKWRELIPCVDHRITGAKCSACRSSDLVIMVKMTGKVAPVAPGRVLVDVQADIASRLSPWVRCRNCENESQYN